MRRRSVMRRVGTAGVGSLLVLATVAGPAADASAVRTPSPATATTGPYFSVPAERRYAWAEDGKSLFLAGATVAVVRGRSPRSVLRMLAPDATTPIESPAAAQRWASGGNDRQFRTVVQARSLGGRWTLVVYPFGPPVTPAATLRRLSRNGKAVVVFEDVELDSSFQVARRGQVVRDFAPVDYTLPWVGRPSRAERWIRFGDHRDYHSMAKSLLLVERLTGLRLSQAVVDSTGHAVAVGVLI